MYQFSCFLLLDMRDLWKTSTLHSARNKQYLFSKTLCLYLGVLKISNIIGHSEEITEELKTVFIHIVPALRWGPQATQHGYFLNFTTFQGCISERLISMSTVLHALSSHQKKRSHDLLICSFYDLFFCHTSNLQRCFWECWLAGVFLWKSRHAAVVR